MGDLLGCPTLKWFSGCDHWKPLAPEHNEYTIHGVFTTKLCGNFVCLQFCQALQIATGGILSLKALFSKSYIVYLLVLHCTECFPRETFADWSSFRALGMLQHNHCCLSPNLFQQLQRIWASAISISFVQNQSAKNYSKFSSIYTLGRRSSDVKIIVQKSTKKGFSSPLENKLAFAWASFLPQLTIPTKYKCCHCLHNHWLPWSSSFPDIWSWAICLFVTLLSSSSPSSSPSSSSPPPSSSWVH